MEIDNIQSPASTRIWSNNAPLSQGIADGTRSRTDSVSSFFSVTSDNSNTDANNADTTLELMRREIENMKKATEKQRNISMDVKNGLKTLGSLLAVLESSRKKGWLEASEKRAPKRQRSPTDEAEAAAKAHEQPAKRKAASNRNGPPKIQLTDDRGNVLEPQPGTSKEVQETEWETVKKQKKKKKKKKKSEPESVRPTGTVPTKRGVSAGSGRPKRKGGAVLIVPKDGKTFADVVRTLRTADTSGRIDVTGITKTKDGAVLLRTKDEQTGQRLSDCLRETLGEQGVIRDMTRNVTLEVLDMDCFTETDEVRDALNFALGINADRKVTVIGPNNRGQKMAICECSNQDATRLLEIGRLKIGFVSCRVRARLMVPRCFKCLGYGHYRIDCTGPDRRDCCWKCGGGGHKAGTCTKAASCFLCPTGDGGGAAHVPGSAHCASFKAALTEARAKQRTAHI